MCLAPHRLGGGKWFVAWGLRDPLTTPVHCAHAELETTRFYMSGNCSYQTQRMVKYERTITEMFETACVSLLVNCLMILATASFERLYHVVSVLDDN